MKKINRREFLTLMASAGTLTALGTLSLPSGAFGQPRGSGGHVVIVGGGFGGATCAKYLRRADPTLQVTLIERETHYVTGPFSNKVVGGLLSMADITVGYEPLSRNHDIQVIHGNVVDIDAAATRVTLDNGQSLTYDRLVVAPGIDLDYQALEGYTEQTTEIMPHAWKPGPQTQLLRNQLEAMDDGGTVIITVPPIPYRCPPGPYERASLIAHYFKRHKPRSKILILDAGDKFPKQPLFMQGWEMLYPGMIEWVPGSRGGQVVEVDPQNMTVSTTAGKHQGAVINVIPPERAGAIAAKAGLADASGWCPVDERTFESTLRQGIHVIGDACTAGKLPKSGTAANSEAKVCARAIVDLLQGQPVGDPSFINACYSLLNPNYGISIAAVFELTAQGIAPIPDASGMSPLKASFEYRQEEAEDAQGWYESMVADSFS